MRRFQIGPRSWDLMLRLESISVALRDVEGLGVSGPAPSRIRSALEKERESLRTRIAKLMQGNKEERRG